ncbi:hypothetical protein BpHYR1_034191 [Brachionus plicatilis]|uniref:Uncharacterized protein n=1 Tax=Brachionus plicatilis TaxID=10195 RepID=A0A3M7RVG0_BRAPC|nr:hypothetical protein BpHYR1_034191 [Brachionus plicatilis]
MLDCDILIFHFKYLTASNRPACANVKFVLHGAHTQGDTGELSNRERERKKKKLKILCVCVQLLIQNQSKSYLNSNTTKTIHKLKSLFEVFALT